MPLGKIIKDLEFRLSLIWALPYNMAIPGMRWNTWWIFFMWYRWDSSMKLALHLSNGYSCQQESFQISRAILDFLIGMTSLILTYGRLLTTGRVRWKITNWLWYAMKNWVLRIFWFWLCHLEAILSLFKDKLWDFWFRMKKTWMDMIVVVGGMVNITHVETAIFDGHSI